MNPVSRGLFAFGVVALVATVGCIPTISIHSYRNTTLTITEAHSGKPLPHLPFRVFYTYAPADSPLFYHLELRTPKDVRGETDEKGQAVVRIADYAWSVGVEAEEGEKGDWRIFWLSKELIRKGDVVETRYEGTNHPKLKLELRPTGPPNSSVERTGGSRLGQRASLSQWRLPPVAHADR
jgi:hypothetical protein